MSNSKKSGFRLPWSGERTTEDEATSRRLAALHGDPSGAASDDLGAGPFGRTEDAQPTTTDAAPAAPDAQAETPEAAMHDADAPMTQSAAAPPASVGEPGSGGWPSSDRRDEATRPFVRSPAESRMPRRDNPLVAGLVKAMREAAVASREETTARLAAEATARVEVIRSRATTETAGLRKRAEDDITGIREWSKAEIARLRQETDERIEGRRVSLAAEVERHAASVNRLVDEVQTTVSTFEADMDQFFGRLLAESDPARLATLAEQAPDPPDLSGEGPSAVEALEDGAVIGLGADDAAEAEAEATEGLDPLAIEAWPMVVQAAAARVLDPAPAPGDANGPDSTRLLVSGLTSVAGISAFKGALGQLPGVRGVSVSSGERGVFIFAVSHDPGVDLDSGVAGLPGFNAHVTDATDDGFTVAATEPVAA